MVTEPTPLTLDDLLKRKVRLPICPTVLLRLTKVIEDGNNNVSDLWSVIRSDPALTAQVLRVSNSAYFGMSRQVSSVEEAVLRIGFKCVWTIAAALTARELYMASSASWAGLNDATWKHSMKAAAYAHALSTRLSPLYSDNYFTAGLLHDIGKLLLNQADPRYAEVYQQTPCGYELAWRETEIWGTHHAKLGGELLQHYNLPKSIVDVVAYHHEPPPKDDEQALMRGLLSVANEMAHADDAGTLSTKAEKPPITPELLEAVGLDLEACVSIGTEAQRMLTLLRLV